MISDFQVDVLAGLQQMNIIHGDVRPELIFVSRFQDESDVDFKPKFGSAVRLAAIGIAYLA